MVEFKIFVVLSHSDTRCVLLQYYLAHLNAYYEVYNLTYICSSLNFSFYNCVYLIFKIFFYCSGFCHTLKWISHVFNFYHQFFSHFSSVQLLSHIWHWDPMDCSMPGFPVHHQLLELAQTHVHWVGDAIQPSHPLSPPSLPTCNLSQYQHLFQWVGSSHLVSKVLEFQLHHQSFQWIFRTDSPYDGLVGSPCSPRDSQESFLTPQIKSISSLVLSFLYSTTRTFIHDDWKNSFDQMDFCQQSNVSGFNVLSRLVIPFLPRNKCILISWLQLPSAVILEPKKIKSLTVSPSICHEVMGLDAMIFVFWMLSLKPAFPLSSFTFVKRPFSSCLLYAVRVVSSAYLRLLIFLLAIFIPACDSSSPVFLMMYST